MVPCLTEQACRVRLDFSAMALPGALQERRAAWQSALQSERSDFRFLPENPAGIDRLFECKPVTLFGWECARRICGGLDRQYEPDQTLNFYSLPSATVIASYPYLYQTAYTSTSRIRPSCLLSLSLRHQGATFGQETEVFGNKGFRSDFDPLNHGDTHHWWIANLATTTDTSPLGFHRMEH